MSRLWNGKKRSAYTLIEMLMYFALLGLLMSFIAMIFRQMMWRDRLEEYIDETMRLKFATDKVNDSLRNAAEIIRPVPMKVSDKLVVMRTDGTFEKIGMYSVDGKMRFVYSKAKTLAGLDHDSSYASRESVYSPHVTAFYIGRPIYNHVIYKLVSQRFEAKLTQNLDGLKIPAPVNITGYYSDDFARNFVHTTNIVTMAKGFGEAYEKSRKKFEETVFTARNIDKFYASFDRYSKAVNPVRSKSRLKGFLSADKLTDIGKIIYFTADLIDRCSNEISVASGAKFSSFWTEEGVSPADPKVIFGLEFLEDYRIFNQRMSGLKNSLSMSPDVESLVAGIDVVCRANASSFTGMRNLAEPYNGQFFNEMGNRVNVDNLPRGMSVPFSPNDVNVFSGFERCPACDGPKASISSIYEVIESKIDYLSNDKTMAENLEVLFYGVKKVKKAIRFGENIDIYDQDVKFPIVVSTGTKKYDLAYFIRQACDLAGVSLPDYSKGTPLPGSIK